MTIFLAVSFIANYAFNQKVEKEIEELFSKVKNKGEIVTREDISDLPKNVKKWLEYSGIIGKEEIVSVYVKQKADMRLEKDKPWMPVEAAHQAIPSLSAFSCRQQRMFRLLNTLSSSHKT